jgi:hypothetical protein
MNRCTADDDKFEPDEVARHARRNSAAHLPHSFRAGPAAGTEESSQPRHRPIKVMQRNHV